MNKRRRSFDVLPMKVSRDAIDNTIEVLRGTDARKSFSRFLRQ